MSGFDLGLGEIKNTFRHVLSSKTVPISKNDEFEIKYMAGDGLNTLSSVLQSLPVLSFTHERGRLTPKTPVFLMAPDYYFKDYTLMNFGLDTVDDTGIASYEVYAQGHQLRQRFSVRAWLPDGDRDVIGVSQCSVKDLYSQTRSAKRLEIERCMPGMADSAALFLKAEKDRLPGFFNDIDANLLRVTAAFITARGSYFMGVHLKEHDAIAVFEVSNDQTLNLTPDLEHVTRAFAHEWEPEAKDVLFLKDRKAAADPSVNSNYLFLAAELVLREYIDRRFNNQMFPAKKSKLERAMDDNHKFFEGSLSETFIRAAQGANRPKPGAHYALNHNITMGYIERCRHRRMIELSKTLTPARQLISAPHVKKTLFDVRKAEMPALTHA